MDSDNAGQKILATRTRATNGSPVVQQEVAERVVRIYQSSYWTEGAINSVYTVSLDTRANENALQRQGEAVVEKLFPHDGHSVNS